MKRKILALLGCMAMLGLSPQVLAAPAGNAHEAPAEHGRQANGEGKGDAHEHELGPINWFDFSNKEQPPWGAYAINFAILVGIYVYYGRDIVKKGLVERRAGIKREIDEAQKLLEEAEKRAKKYQKKLEHLDKDMEAAKKALVDAGVLERERLIREAREKAARMERDAELLLEAELKQMREDLLRETLDDAVNAAEELLKKSITQADHERLAEEYLQQLSAMKPGDLQVRGAS
jgi:F-type H+-transporting ATPase subunit b